MGAKTMLRAPRARWKQPEAEDKSWGERAQLVRDAFANIPEAFRLVWRADRRNTIWMAVLTVLGASLPAAQAYAGKLIIDSVIASYNAGVAASVGLQAAAPYLLFEFALILVGAFSGQQRRLVEHVLNARLGNQINNEIIRKALDLDLYHFENAEFYDKLQNARREADYRALAIVTGGFMLIQNVLTLASFLVILVAFSPLLALLLFGATLPSFIAQSRYSNLYFRLLTWRAPEFRLMSYLEQLLTVDSTIKEVKLFNLGDPLLKRYNDTFWRFFAEDERLARRRSMISTLWGLVGSATYYGAYAWVIYRAVSGGITIGDITLYVTIIRSSQGTFQGMLDNLNRLYESGLFMDNLFSFLKLETQMTSASDPRPIPRPIREGIEFRDVSFRYPGREDWALRHVNLLIRPGEKLALVGANGAGKTTMIKLLTRLYDPTEGQILIDGVDMREYDPSELRERVGVIFQDFVHYQLSARENIGFGQIKALGDEPRVLSAAERGGADDVVAELPDGYDTVLGRWFENGHELSGGQWQKIALGRAFMRDGEVLVLDEPTSALDAEREYEIFQRFRELTEGKIAVLISHRFSTVRMADRIAVIADGRVSELGSHQELLALGGTYAHLFELQASGYR
jgi:ATP-binding cassette, subfamily B, bacterial